MAENMNEDQQVNGDSPQLPQEPIDWLTKPLIRFLRIEAAAGLVLLLFTMAALMLSNSSWGHPFLEIWETPLGIQLGSSEFTRSLHEWINDALMTLFFFLVALELKRELVLGELRNLRVAALSISAALGGMLVPIFFYWILQSGQPGQDGWGTVMSTDTAFVIGCLALLGTRIPYSLRVFMLSLAIIDDIGAILVVAIGYSSGLRWQALVLAAAGVVIVRGMALLGIRNIAIYFLVGSLIWIAVDASGIHATATGVILGLMTPTGKWVSDARLHTILDQVVAYPPGDHWRRNTEARDALQMAETAARETLSPVERLEMMLHPWVGFVIMPLFAFANAGVPLSFADLGNSITVAVFVGFFFGKPLGVFVFSWLAVRTGMAIRPLGLSWLLLAAGSLLTGIGFTMALFIANLAFSPSLINAAKLGILLASVFSATVGVVLLMGWSTWGKSPKTSTGCFLLVVLGAIPLLILKVLRNILQQRKTTLVNYANSLSQKASRVWAILSLAVKKFSWIDGAQWAGAFSFYAFFSLFPLIVLLVTIASIFIDQARAATEIIAYIETYIPITGEKQSYIFDTMTSIVTTREQTGVVALLMLGWAAMQFFATLICATNRAWGAGTDWWQLPSKSLAFLAIMIFVILMGITVPMLAKMAKDWLFPMYDFSAWIYALGGFVIPSLVVFLSLCLFYRLAPRRPTRFSEVWTAALCTTALLYAAENLFVIYLKDFATLNAVYGAFGGIMALLLWIYLSGCIFIFGACLCAAQAEGCASSGN
ncbi:Na+/H+ antiporter NhaA [Methylobacter sp. YRD-M1]|uniref:Na+/H+ antiporter NhaA n=1 Tax=Methylobacter sp. YRD-M1 TaxID=2911520 RepID=UPI00227B3DEF|nr:Na+/H+ antiporter NhaA [Methylobacter sp. YRD-M1]WAK00511.1 Na+/H+ antiporter NhaA [Methylobacter sp. YRD-M1]